MINSWDYSGFSVKMGWLRLESILARECNADPSGLYPLGCHHALEIQRPDKNPRHKQIVSDSMLNLTSSFSSRRSHLDSASYRTLVRIFSLCLDLDDDVESPLNPSQNPNPTPTPTPSLDPDSNGDTESVEESGRREAEKGVTFTDSPQEPANRPSPNPNLAEESAGDGKGNEAGIEKGEVFMNSSSFEEEVSDAVKELEFDDECFDLDLLEGMVTECAKLIDGQQDDIVLHSADDDELEVKNQERGINSEKATTVEARQRTEISEISQSSALRDGMRDNSGELKSEDEMNEERVAECFNGEATAEATAFEKFTRVEDTREIREGSQQETRTNSDPLVEHCGEGALEDVEVDDEDFEEGEIPNDFDNSNQSLEEDDKELHKGSVCEGFDKNETPNYKMPTFSSINPADGHSKTTENYFANSSPSTLISANRNQGIKAFGDDADIQHKAADSDTLGLSQEILKNLANKEKEKPSETEVVELKVRQKRGSRSEGRKAKNKIAKKRKRAQKAREQGVKRLKLQPIVKPKEVKYCNFYLMGRCQQGDLCKFSHDTTPLTKSQPCKHFACDSCLKGGDCPFDHQLSKYPCHNMMSKGMCIRGDRCKFSHKLPVTDGSSPASATSKADTLSSSGKQNLVKQLHMNRASQGAINQQPKSNAASSSQFSAHKPSAGNLVNAPKEPMRIPNGIRFLSFGKGPAGNAEKQKINPQKQDKLLAAGYKNFSNLVQGSLSAAQCEKNARNMPVCHAATASNAVKKSNEGCLQSEVLEASKLLEEFLFSGTS